MKGCPLWLRVETTGGLEFTTAAGRKANKQSFDFIIKFFYLWDPSDTIPQSQNVICTEEVLKRIRHRLG